MKKNVIHPLTTAGIGFAIASVTLLLSGFPVIAGGLALGGIFFTIPEVPKYSSVYQFIMLSLQSVLLGLSLDTGHYHFPLFTVSMFLVAQAGLIRLVFYNSLLHTKAVWLEPFMLLTALAAIIVYNVEQHGDWHLWVFPLLPLLFMGFLVFGFVKEGIAYNAVAKHERRVEVGVAAPDFELVDQFSQPVALSSFRNQRALLLLFIRGDWCPACHMMLRSYERNRDKFKEKNVMLLAIGPDEMDVNRQLAEKLGIDYRILADPGMQTAKRYGVHLEKDPVPGRNNFESGHAMPSSFLVCEQGVIRYRSRADRAGEFLNPELIFEALAKLTRNG